MFKNLSLTLIHFKLTILLSNRYSIFWRDIRNA
nr:MAG TPA: hypothetical protein [Caudoviricetes sp.]DAK96395.1 MAG TPA: hypothetical protein [Caudoviricetes sp.]